MRNGLSAASERTSKFSRCPITVGHLIPRHRAATPDDVVAAQRTGGNADNIREPQPDGEGEIVPHNLFEGGMIPAYRVHLVDDPEQIAKTEQQENMALVASLWERPLAGINHQYAMICPRRAPCRAPGILLVVGRIDHNECATGCGEVAMTDIATAALLALRKGSFGL